MKKSKIKRVKLEIKKPIKDHYFSARSVTYQIPFGGGAEYESNPIDIEVTKDKAIYFSSDDSENFIYFYYEQIPHLIKALAEFRRFVRERK